MDSPVRQYLKLKDYQRHKLFRKIRRRRKAEAQQAIDAPMKELKRRLKRYGDGKEDERLKPWKALKNIDYDVVPDTTFTSDKTGVGNIEYFSAEHPEGITYPNGYHKDHPLPGKDVILYNPNDNDEQDVRLDALHIMPKDATYDTLNTLYRNAARDGDVFYNAKARYNEDAQKYGTNNIDSFEQYFNNEADGLLRNLLIEGTPEYIKSKRYYPDKRQLKDWNSHLTPYVDAIQNYLETGVRPQNILPEIVVKGKNLHKPKKYDGGKNVPMNRSIDGVNLWRDDQTGQYFYQEANGPRIDLTPFNTLGSDDPTTWSFLDAEGKEYNPRRGYVGPTISQTTDAQRVANEVRDILNTRTWRSDVADQLHNFGDALLWSTMAMNPEGEALMMKASEKLASLGRLAKPMFNKATLAIENYRYPFGRPQIPNNFLTIDSKNIIADGENWAASLPGRKDYSITRVEPYSGYTPTNQSQEYKNFVDDVMQGNSWGRHRGTMYPTKDRDFSTGVADLEQIGSGAEATVLKNPDDPSRVLKFSRDSSLASNTREAAVENAKQYAFKRNVAPYNMPLSVEGAYESNGLFYPVFSQERVTPISAENILSVDDKIGKLNNSVRGRMYYPGAARTNNILSENDIAQTLDFKPENVGILDDGSIMGIDLGVDYTGRIPRVLSSPQITAENATSMTPEQWTAAQDAAIAKGDIAEALRLRDLHFQVSAPNTVASVNGQPLQLYHGTDATFNAFDISKYGSTDGGTFGRGVYTTPIRTYAGLYGENNMPLYMKLDNPRDYRNSSIGDLIAEKFAFGDDFATGNGIDGVIGRPSWKGFKGLEEYVSHNPKNIKSSLPITYDNNGVRIPLGERDNFNINDIRYGLLPFGIGLGTFGALYGTSDSGTFNKGKDSGIHIKPLNRGKFNALKKRTGKTTEQLTHSKNPLTRKRAIFALNARKWHHK